MLEYRQVKGKLASTTNALKLRPRHKSKDGYERLLEWFMDPVTNIRLTVVWTNN